MRHTVEKERESSDGSVQGPIHQFQVIQGVRLDPLAETIYVNADCRARILYSPWKKHEREKGHAPHAVQDNEQPRGPNGPHDPPLPWGKLD